MKIRIYGPCGYDSLRELEFPIVVEVRHIEEVEDKPAYVTASTMRAYGVETCDGDYTFFDEEYDLVEEEVLWTPRTLEDCFGANPTPEALAANQRAADLSMKDMTEAMSKEDRKGLLIQLVQDYGVAINDGCYESECGSLQAMLACHEEEKRLLAEIIKMIEEGV